MSKVISKAEYERRRSNDFNFMVLCEHKHNMEMYRLLRDRDLDDVLIAETAGLRLAEDGA